MIYPAHQLKNVIAALYSSRSGGKKAFEKGGVALGWQPIVDQYNRDQHRVALGIGRHVPGLRYSYVERDCWKRLNVMPAKIMQQRYMIAALNEYASEQPQPADTATVSETAKFLHACNLTFEKGVLSHAFISSENSSILKNVKSGWQYFVEWAEEHHNTDYTDNSKRARSLKFLAWQTFDLHGYGVLLPPVFKVLL
ncbi:uncharacterized protein [Montipora foliosa]|uniref:uncharacterized protein n=1 Tax=Montipora foliosa TaxID=591990 RepID=UPI0035F18EA0